MNSYNEKRMVKIFGFLSFMAALIPYLMTVAPTVSFWDCGEFIACGATLSVPHPPGAPLFILLNRIATMFFTFINEPSLRINLISPVSGAFTALFIFLSINRMIRFFFDPSKEENTFLKLAPILGGFAGALFSSYSFSAWFNNVEAEVYGVANAVLALMFWLGLKWYDYRGTRQGDRILLLITYIGYLGIGFQLYTVIPIPFIFLFVLLNDEEKRKHWQLWLIGFCMLSIMYSISSFLTIGPVLMLYCILWVVLERETSKVVNGVLMGIVALYSLYSALPTEKGDEFEGLNFVLGLVYAALAILPFILKAGTRDKERTKWWFCFYIVFFAFLGFSIHFYIPVRSYLDPYIDENNPEVVINSPSDLFQKKTWDQFIYYVERKQYGNESMIMRMFHRRGTFYNQFVNHQHMGFGGYLAVQFFHLDGKDAGIDSGDVSLGSSFLPRVLRLTAYLIPMLLVGWAIFFVYKRNRSVALYMGLSLLATTIGLIFYMNFADGTIPEFREMEQWEQSGRQGPEPQPIQMEVRERDYFWNPGFMLYSLWVGVGFSALMIFLADRYRKKKRVLMPVMALLLLAAPVLPFTMNMGIKTRENNWVAYDYAYNLLMSCERDGILFTNGDNDTFPLWTLQETYGIRRDVKVVNLSLLNTDWYIAQLMDNEPRLVVPTVIFDEMFQPHPMSKEDFLKQINHRRNLLPQPLKAKISDWQLEVEIPSQQQLSFIRIQDYMTLNIVHGNAGTRPIYFAVTVSEGNLMGLMPYLEMQGLTYRLTQEKKNTRMNLPISLAKMDRLYRYTNLGKSNCYLPDETERLLSNYAACFIGYVYEERTNLAALREKEAALTKELSDMSANKKASPLVVADKAKELSSVKSEADAVFENIRRELNHCISILPLDWRGRLLSAQIFAGDNKMDLAEKVLRDGLKLQPDEYMYNANLGFLLRDRGNNKEALPLLEKVVNTLDSDFKAIKHRETGGAISALLDIYKSSGQIDKAEALLRRWIDANPGDRRAVE